jgi:hypothetical protein
MPVRLSNVVPGPLIEPAPDARCGIEPESGDDPRRQSELLHRRWLALTRCHHARDTNQCLPVKRTKYDTFRAHKRQCHGEHPGEPFDTLSGVVAQRRNVKRVVAHAARDDANGGGEVCLGEFSNDDHEDKSG